MPGILYPAPGGRLPTRTLFTALERRVKYRAVCASCSREVAFHSHLRDEEACRDPGDLVNTCNLERRLEVTSSNLATFSLLSSSDCVQSLITWVPSWTGTSPICSTLRGKGMSTISHPRREANQCPVELRLPQLRLH